MVLEERASEFCADLSKTNRHYPLRYMLMVFTVVEDKQASLPAVTHEGGSGRFKTIREEWNQRYYRLIERFGDEIGVPVLLNTSFNLRGGPIAASTESALNTFQRSGIDSIYIGDCMLRKG